jgi:hypothetical protein
MPDTSVRFDAVEVLRDSGLALLCVIKGRRVWVPKLQMLQGSRLARPGDRGPLVVPDWFAADQEL